MDEHPIEALKDSVTHGVERLEASRKLGVPVATTRRFFEIGGLDLGGLLALELFTTVIPLILIGFGWFSNFSANLSFGDLMIRQLDLTGEGAAQMHDLFGTGASIKSTWTVVGLASFLVWGIPMSSQVAKTFARAWKRERFGFLEEVWRGALWFVLFLGTQLLTVLLTGQHHSLAPRAILFALGLLPAFALWMATPAILVRKGALGVKHLVWCGVAGVLLDVLLIRLVTRILIPALLSGWEGFGPIGAAMTLMTWCTVCAALWVITACLGAVLWERNAPNEMVMAAQALTDTAEPASIG